MRLFSIAWLQVPDIPRSTFPPGLDTSIDSGCSSIMISCIQGRFTHQKDLWPCSVPVPIIRPIHLRQQPNPRSGSKRTHAGVIRCYSLAVALYASLSDLVKLPDHGRFRPLAPTRCGSFACGRSTKALLLGGAWVKCRWETIGKTSQSRLIFKSALL
jgi:hypothetical protein